MFKNYIIKWDATSTVAEARAEAEEFLTKLNNDTAFCCEVSTHCQISVQPKTYTTNDWYELVTTDKIPYSPASFNDWIVFMNHKGISSEISEVPVKKSYKDPQYNLYHTEVVGYRYFPTKRWNEDMGEYDDEEYYIPTRTPFWEAVVALHNDPHTVDIAVLLRSAYYFYEAAYNAVKISNALLFNNATSCLMNLAFTLYKEAMRLLYAYNAKFKYIAGDVKINIRDLEFNEMLTHEPERCSGGFTIEELDKATYAACVFDCGYTTDDLQGVINKHPERFTFYEWCVVPVTYAIDTDDYGRPRYAKVEAAKDLKHFKTVGKKDVVVFEDDIIRQLIKCYDYFMSLSETDRRMFYRKEYDEYGREFVFKSIHAYANFKWRNASSLTTVDFQAGLYADKTAIDPAKLVERAELGKLDEDDDEYSYIKYGSDTEYEDDDILDDYDQTDYYDEELEELFD